MHKCIPVVQINSGIALKYGISECVETVASMITEFDDQDVPIKYLEFGNEMFGV